MFIVECSYHVRGERAQTLALVAAMNFFSHAKGERFRFQLVMKNLQTASGLINEPKLGAGLADFCVSALEFANALVNSPEDVRARMHLRSELLDLSMERVLQV